MDHLQMMFEKDQYLKWQWAVTAKKLTVFKNRCYKAKKELLQFFCGGWKGEVRSYVM